MKSRWFQSVIAVALAIVLALFPVTDAWARSGGRMGGGSFRRSVPSYSAPRSSITRVAPPMYGGGWGFPLLIPFFGGGGGLLTLMLVLGVGSFLIRNLRPSENAEGLGSSKVQLREVKIGLLATARGLQKEMDRLAMEADTDSPQGLAALLQNVTLSLVRHEDYWVYAQAHHRTLSREEAEQAFYQESLQERSKFSVETLSRINGSVQQKTVPLADEAGEYLVVTLLVAADVMSGTLPVVDSASGLRRSLLELGSTSADRLVAVEILWTPQQEGDTLTAEQLLLEYPQMRRL